MTEDLEKVGPAGFRVGASEGSGKTERPPDTEQYLRELYVEGEIGEEEFEERLERVIERD